jgi:hypothetical protein
MPPKLKPITPLSARELYQTGKLHRQVVLRLWLMALFVVAASVLVSYEIIEGKLSWPIILEVSIPSFLLGFFFARIYRMDWNEQEELVVTSRMDWISGTLLVLYGIFRVVSDKLLTQFYPNSGGAVAASFVLLLGVALGRLVGMTVIVQRTYIEGKNNR